MIKPFGKHQYLHFLVVTLATLVSLHANAWAEKLALPGLQARGMIIAVHQPVISSQIAGRIQKLTVGEGETFTKNDLLVEFDDALLQAQHRKTKAELEAAKAMLTNKLKLAELESVGTLAVSLAKSETESRMAEMKIADITLARCTIHAPFNGRVVELFVSEHENVAPNQKLMEIVSSDQLEIEIMARSNWLSWLRPGVACTVQIDAIQKNVVAHIVAVGAIVDPVSKMVKIRAELDKNATVLLPGMMATVFFNVNETTVPPPVEGE